MDNNQRIAQEVLAAVGGAENIAGVVHCMTRLRFTLIDPAVPADDEVKAIIDRAYARCEEILTARREALTAVAEYLLAHETMTGEEFERMVGEKA